MFRGSTIRELTGLVDAVMRTHKTPSCIAALVTVTPDPTPHVLGVGNPVADCLAARSSRMPVILAPQQRDRWLDTSMQVASHRSRKPRGKLQSRPPAACGAEAKRYFPGPSRQLSSPITMFAHRKSLVSPLALLRKKGRK